MVHQRPQWIVLLALVAAWLAGCASTTNSPPPNRPDHASILRIDAETGVIRDTFPTGPVPLILVVADGHVWTQNFDDSTLTHVDPDRGLATTIDVGPVAGLAADGRKLWVARDGRVVARLDPATGDTEVEHTLAEEEVFDQRRTGFVGVGFGSLWLTLPATGRGDELWRIEPATGAVVVRIPTGGQANPPFLTERHVWLVTKQDRGVTRVDVRTGEAVAMNAGRLPWAIAIVNGSAWVSDGSRIIRLDEQSLEATGEVTLDSTVRGLAVGDGRLWAAAEDGVYAIDPGSITTRQVLEVTFPNDTGPIGIAYLEGEVWISIE